MHNSEDGTNMNGTTTPIDRLLKNSCLGCHSDASTDAMLSANQAPVVYHSGGEPTKFLAGGDFWWADEDTGQGHNPWELDEIAGTADGVTWDDAQITQAEGPPGNVSGGIFTTGSDFLGCINYNDGTNNVTGCHVYNAHHNNKGGADGTTNVYWVDGSDAGNSYRFLYNSNGGVKGGEMGNWEYTGTTGTDNHNLYFGADDSTWNTDQTISRFCGECHGNFHGMAAGAGNASEVEGNTNAYASPWVRHPTDFPLTKAKGGTGGVYIQYGAYDPLVPIGTDDDRGATSATPIDMDGVYDNYFDASLDIVLCVSCHRVHGSPNANILRWPYSDMTAGSAASTSYEGCFKCHRDK